MTLAAAALAAFVGCATSAKKLNRISVGMTKVEVIKILGDPDSTAANEGCEYMIYTLREGVSKPGTTPIPIAIDGSYFVRIVGGKVNAYGRRGDFDSTQPSESKQTIDLNVKQK